MNVKSVCVALCVLGTSAMVCAAEVTVEQKNKQFVSGNIKIKKGDKVNFKNSDEVNHNVFSLSDTKSFDLGSYPKGQSRAVTFDKAGVVEVECAIHPEMMMKIEVQE